MNGSRLLGQVVLVEDMELGRPVGEQLELPVNHAGSVKDWKLRQKGVFATLDSFWSQ